MNCKILLFSVFLVFTACKEKSYEPDGLTKLTDSELIERAKQKNFPDIETIVYRNEKGDIISADSVQKIFTIEEWFVDWYVDKNGIVKEFVLSKATEHDRQLHQKIREAYEFQPPIKFVEINCENKSEILQNVFDSDQSMRTNGAINPEIDRQNLATVISLIEKCGMPTLSEVDDVQMSAVWLVFQHGDNANRKKYLPLLEKSAKNGDLDATAIAMMKDRTLMTDGEPQVYGTQVTKNGGEWVLYELDNPETVNKRRAAIGFGPLQDYLNRWNIRFDIKQTE